MPRSVTTSQALLGLLALRPSWTASELADEVHRNMRFFWPRARSRAYAQLKKLVDDGLASAAIEARSGRGAPTRTRYKLTAKGHRSLAQWLTHQPQSTVLESEALLRVLLGHVGPPESLLVALDAMRRDGEAIIEVAHLVADEYVAGTAPFQSEVHTRALLFDFLAGHATLMIEWADRANKIVESWSTMSEKDRDLRAVEHIASLRKGLPRIPGD